jgi:putative ABC transport system permease protein
MRKVLGAVRTSLAGQFLGESLLMAVIAFIFAVLLIVLSSSVFEQISGQRLSSTPASYGVLLVIFFGLAVVTGIVAGSYPAFYLSSFRPIEVLKGRFPSSLAAISLRKGLVVFQFVISVILIIVTLVIREQMRFLRTADLGFSRDKQIVVPLQSKTAKSIYAALKSELLGEKQVLSVGASAYYPGIVNSGTDNFHKEGQSVSAGPLLRINHVDEDFQKTLGVRAIAGRLFSAEYVATDTIDHAILNEEAVRKIGFASPKDALGKKILSTYNGTNYSYEVVGVVTDFHYEDLHNPVLPYMFLLNGNYNYAIVHAGDGDMDALLKSLEKTWHKLDPGEPFTYSFMDEDFQRNYSSDQRLSGIVNCFTFIAVLISCLGLFGLTSFSAEQRSKEISIRKVLGARVAGLVALLSKDFLKLVLIAIVVASPVAWVVMHKWLQGFTDSVTVGWGVFGFTALGVVVMAFLTISFQVVRAAMANPIEHLKNE